MTRALIEAALLATLALPQAASAQDPRLVDRDYDPAEIVRVEGRVNVQATIRFADGESIQNIAIGDSQKWQVTPARSGNLLFVKPLAERATTNMTVVTDRRVYLFDLLASPTHRNPLYVLSFSYPEQFLVKEEIQVAEAETQEPSTDSASAVELAAANDDYAVLDPARLNFDWAAHGAPGLLPEQVYDDGEATFLVWSAGASMPAILVMDEDGTEGPVNFAVRGEMIVLDLVPGEIILRSGNDTARLIHNGSAAPALAGARL